MGWPGILRDSLPSWRAVAALLGLALLAAGASAEELLSSVNCTSGADPAVQVCVLEKVFLWGGQIYFLTPTPDRPPALPSIRLSFFQPPDGPFSPFSLQDYVQNWAPATLPFDPLNPEERLGAAVLYKRTHTLNWFHTFTEDTANLFSLFCVYLGLCSWHDFHCVGKETAIVALDPGPSVPVTGNFKEAFDCLGKTVLLWQPRERPVFVGRLLVGTGQFCNPPHCHTVSLGRTRPLLPEVQTGWVSVMRQCAGLPPEPVKAQGPPHVLFVNRALTSGRSVLPMSQVFANFTRAHSGVEATFGMAFLESTHWKAAAALFDQADVIVTPHGAQTSQAVFMRHQSQFVHVEWNIAQAQLTGFVVDSVGSYIRIARDVLLVDLDSETVAVMEQVIKELRGVKDLDLAGMQHIIVHHLCPGEDCPDFNNWSRLLHYNPPAEALYAKVNAAIARWQQAHPQSRRQEHAALRSRRHVHGQPAGQAAPAHRRLAGSSHQA